MEYLLSQSASDPAAAIERVRREATATCPPDLAPMLDDCVRQAVEELRNSRVKTFVPLLALRRVKCCLRAGTCDTDEY
jgi:hypothetical protein